MVWTEQQWQAADALRKHDSFVIAICPDRAYATSYIKNAASCLSGSSDYEVVLSMSGMKLMLPFFRSRMIVTTEEAIRNGYLAGVYCDHLITHPTLGHCGKHLLRTTMKDVVLREEVMKLT